MTQSIVTPNHPAAAVTYAPTRDMAGDFGHGTARREDPNMLRSKPVQITLGGKTQPQWGQSRAVEFRGGVLPKSRAMDVNVRSGNQDPTAVGLDNGGGHWGLMGTGDPIPVSTDLPSWAKLLGVAVLGYVAYRHMK